MEEEMYGGLSRDEEEEEEERRTLRIKIPTPSPEKRGGEQSDGADEGDEVACSASLLDVSPITAGDVLSSRVKQSQRVGSRSRSKTREKSVGISLP
eukprot:303161-Hanusia_phi.AAC.1